MNDLPYIPIARGLSNRKNRQTNRKIGALDDLNSKNEGWVSRYLLDSTNVCEYQLSYV